MPEETTGLGETVPEQPEGGDPETPGGDTSGQTIVNEGTQIITNETDDGGDGGNHFGRGLDVHKMICKAFADAREDAPEMMGPDFLNPGFCGFDKDKKDKKDKGGENEGPDGADEPEADEPEAEEPEGTDMGETIPQEETSPEETTAAPEETTAGGQEPPAEPPTEGAEVR